MTMTKTRLSKQPMSAYRFHGSNATAREASRIDDVSEDPIRISIGNTVAAINAITIYLFRKNVI